MYHVYIHFIHGGDSWEEQETCDNVLPQAGATVLITGEQERIVVLPHGSVQAIYAVQERPDGTD